MKLSCAFSIVVLFVTGLNIPLVGSQNGTSTTALTTGVNNSTNSSSTAASTTPSISATSTPASTSATTTSQTTTPITYNCIAYTCALKGCLANANNTVTNNCTGLFCTMVQRFDQTFYNITADCGSNCTAKDETTGNFTVRTRCCQSHHCNKDDVGIVALGGNGGSATSPTLVWILSIILFIAAFKILL